MMRIIDCSLCFPFSIDLEHPPTFELREMDRIRAQKFDRMNEALLPLGSAEGDG